EILWAGLSGQSLNGHRKPQVIGYDPSWLKEADQDVQDAFSIFLAACVKLGVPTKPVTLPDLDDVSDTHGALFLDEALTWHMRHFADQRTEFPTIAQTWFDLAEQADPMTVSKAKDHRTRLTATLGAILSEVDFIATPTLLQAAIPRIAETIEIAGQTMETTMAMVRTTSLFNHTGHPAIALPIGSMKDGAQASLQLVAARSQETALLRMADSIQSHFVELARTIPTPKP
ncbi:MAG: amidase family protein, partial [Pseudomonadota bacterium]